MRAGAAPEPPGKALLEPLVGPPAPAEASTIEASTAEPSEDSSSLNTVSSGAGAVAAHLLSESPGRLTLAVMGLSGVGKTALCRQYVVGSFEAAHEPTIEDLHRKEAALPGGARACLSILDTAGQDAYSVLRRSWMQSSTGFLFVFSLADRRTFEELPAFREELVDLYHDSPPPSVLVANKADLHASEWAVSHEEAWHLQSRWPNCLRVVHASALSGDNVAEAFEPLCLAARSWAAARRLRPAPAAGQLDACTRQRTACCCRRTRGLLAPRGVGCPPAGPCALL